MFTQHFYLGRTYHGCVKRVRVLSRLGELVAPAGYAFFCPICGDIWARCYIENEPIQCITQFCEKHRPGDKVGSWSSGHVFPWQLPGSLWLSYDKDFCLALPESLLQREITLAFPGWLSQQLYPAAPIGA